MDVKLPEKPRRAPPRKLGNQAIALLGLSNSGKSWLGNHWDLALNIDMTGGQREYGGFVIDVEEECAKSGGSPLDVVREVVKMLSSSCPYSAVVFDTLDAISLGLEREVVRDLSKAMGKDGSALGDFPPTMSYTRHRDRVDLFLRAAKSLPCDTIFLMDAKPSTTEDSMTGELMVDLPGRSGTMAIRSMGHVGLCYVNDDNEYKISFRSSRTEDCSLFFRQAGSNWPEWNGRTMPASYEELVSLLGKE